MSIFYKKALAPMVSRAMASSSLSRSATLMRPSFAVGMVRSYYRAHEDQSLILPNNIDTHKPEFKVNLKKKNYGAFAQAGPRRTLLHGSHAALFFRWAIIRMAINPNWLPP